MLVFSNAGKLDIRSITTFGVSAKDNDSAIGFFGTGLKYAISVILRHSGTINIYTGHTRYSFHTREDEIRGKTFNLVYMTTTDVHTNQQTAEQQMGFTTELGKTWELWQAFRELYCNTTDEFGYIDMFTTKQWKSFIKTLYPADCKGEPNQTVIAVEGMDDVWSVRDSVILPPKHLLIKHKDAEIHSGVNHEGIVYYRGIRAGRFNKPTMYTYNVTRSCDLSEDRTLKYHWQVSPAVALVIGESLDPELITKVVLAGGGWWEHSLDFDGIAVSQVFQTTVKSLCRAGQRVNHTARKACVLFDPDAFAPPAIQLDALDAARLRKAIQFCRSLGYSVDDYPINVFEFLGDDVLGTADTVRKTVQLSSRVFAMGTKMLAGTLIEEWAHIRFGHHDCSRNMQNWLFDQLCSLGERVTGEPL